MDGENEAKKELKLIRKIRRFAVLYKRLEKERFKIPNLLSIRSITHDQLRWLFDGLDIDKITGFKSLKYTAFY